MSAVGPLERILRQLDAAGIPHMLAGSFASTYYGEPRTTHDVDIVIDPSRSALDDWVRGLSPELYYVSAQAADEAWRRRGPFNVIELQTGWKIDLILRKDRPFSREEFARRIEARIAGVPCRIATAEDTILAKLEWARAGESERQLRDVASILTARGDRLDHAYIERWAPELGVTELWHQLLADASGGA